MMNRKTYLSMAMLAGLWLAALTGCTSPAASDKASSDKSPATETASDKTSSAAVSSSAETNPVVETILSRRSIRKYKSTPVEDSKLQAILKCGIHAPNGMYKQSWQIRVVRNSEFLAQIDEGFMAQRQKAGLTGKARAFYGAPCLIFIAYDKHYDLSQVDCGLLGENMILAAQSMGLGTCCLGQVNRFMLSDEGAPLRARLDLPDTHELLYAIAVGYPDETPAAKPRDMGRVKFID